MEHEHTLNSRSPFPDEPLSLPHFDDEATLQSARPVVPLHEVKATVRSRRRLLLGAALMVAAIFGAVTASLIYSQHAQPQEVSGTASTPDPSQPASDSFVSPSGEATGSSLDSSESAAPESESPIVIVAKSKAAANGRNADTVRRQTVQSSRVRKQPGRAASRPAAQDRDNEIAADEVEDRREQRREARRLRRERRVNNRTGDGLTRIREIFEGSPRP